MNLINHAIAVKVNELGVDVAVAVGVQGDLINHAIAVVVLVHNVRDAIAVQIDAGLDHLAVLDQVLLEGVVGRRVNVGHGVSHAVIVRVHVVGHGVLIDHLALGFKGAIAVSVHFLEGDVALAVEVEDVGIAVVVNAVDQVVRAIAVDVACGEVAEVIRVELREVEVVVAAHDVVLSRGGGCLHIFRCERRPDGYIQAPNIF